MRPRLYAFWRSQLDFGALFQNIFKGFHCQTEVEIPFQFKIMLTELFYESVKQLIGFLIIALALLDKGLRQTLAPLGVPQKQPPADGLHFNDDGHRVIAEKLKAFIEAI